MVFTVDLSMLYSKCPCRKDLGKDIYHNNAYLIYVVLCQRITTWSMHSTWILTVMSHIYIFFFFLTWKNAIL